MKTTEGIEIPDDWCSKLEELKSSDKDAMVAGGAIRDLYYGVLPKDVDFFTRGVVPGWEVDPSDPKLDYKGMRYILGVSLYKGPLPLNVILFEKDVTNGDLLASFDFGFCQIAFDGKRILKTAAFEWDFKYNIITMRNVDRYQRSIRRYARWIDRYRMDVAIPQLDKINAQPL